jgi:hypothetical protein
LKWWLTKLLADHWEILYMYAELDKDERTEMQPRFEDLHNPSQLVTTLRLSGMSLHPTAANHAALTQMFLVLTKQLQVFAQVVQLRRNRVLHTWLSYTGLSGFDIRASDLYQQSGVAQVRVLHGLRSQPNITTSMIYPFLKCQDNYTHQLMEHGDVVVSDIEDEC